MNLRSPHITVGLLPVLRRDLRHAVQVNWTFACTISASDSRRMVRRSGLLDSSVPEFPFRANPEPVLEEPPSSISDVFPVILEDLGPIDIHKTRFGLRQALDCELATATSRALTQSARTVHSFKLRFACSISGTLDRLQSPFPARLQLAAGLRHRLR